MYDRSSNHLGFIPLVAAGLAPTAGPAAALSLTKALSLVASFAGPLGSLFRGSNPKKDAERKQRIDSYYQSALAGDIEGEGALRCYAGEAVPASQLPPEFGTDADTQCLVSDPRGHAAGSAVARGYAQAKLAELVARRAVAGVGGTLIRESGTVGPVAARIVRQALPYVAIGGGLVLLYVLTRRRRVA